MAITTVVLPYNCNIVYTQRTTTSTTTKYLDYAFLGLLQQFRLDFFDEERIEDLVEGSFDNHATLSVPLLDQVAELVLQIYSRESK